LEVADRALAIGELAEDDEPGGIGHRLQELRRAQRALLQLGKRRRLAAPCVDCGGPAARRNAPGETARCGDTHGLAAQPANPSAAILASYGAATALPGTSVPLTLAQSSGFSTISQPAS